MKLSNLKVNGSTIANPNNREIFNRYLLEISKLKPLSREEETNLFKEIELNNDQKAIDKLCKHNLLFVVSVAKSYGKILNNSSLTLEDLISEGNIGLCLAINKFEYKTGNKFISYAVWWIRQHVLKCIQDNIKSIRIPSNVRSVISKYNKKEANLEQFHSRKPTTIEVFESMLEDGNDFGSAQKLDTMLEISTYERSLDSLVIMDGTVELGDLIKSDELPLDVQLIEKERSELIEKMLNEIPIDIKGYLNDYFGLNGETPLTYCEIAEKYEQNTATVKMRMDRYLRRMKYKNHNLKKELLLAN